MADDPGRHHRTALANSRINFEKDSFCSYRRNLLALNRVAIWIAPTGYVRKSAAAVGARIGSARRRSSRVDAQVKSRIATG